MNNPQFYIFGVPNGFDMYNAKPERVNFFQLLYDNECTDRKKMVIYRNADNSEVSYIYLRYNLLAVNNRRGAFLGMSLTFCEGYYCKDIQKVLNLFEEIYSAISADAILTTKIDHSAGQARYRISRFAEATTAIIKIEDYVAEQTRGWFGDCVEPMDETFRLNTQSISLKNGLYFDTKSEHIIANLKTASWVYLTYKETNEEEERQKKKLQDLVEPYNSIHSSLSESHDVTFFKNKKSDLEKLQQQLTQLRLVISTKTAKDLQSAIESDIKRIDDAIASISKPTPPNEPTEPKPVPKNQMDLLNELARSYNTINAAIPNIKDLNTLIKTKSELQDLLHQLNTLQDVKDSSNWNKLHSFINTNINNIEKRIKQEETREQQEELKKLKGLESRFNAIHKEISNKQSLKKNRKALLELQRELSSLSHVLATRDGNDLLSKISTDINAIDKLLRSGGNRKKILIGVGSIVLLSALIIAFWSKLNTKPPTNPIVAECNATIAEARTMLGEIQDSLESAKKFGLTKNLSYTVTEKFLKSVDSCTNNLETNVQDTELSKDETKLKLLNKKLRVQMSELNKSFSDLKKDLNDSQKTGTEPPTFHKKEYEKFVTDKRQELTNMDINNNLKTARNYKLEQSKGYKNAYTKYNTINGNLSKLEQELNGKNPDTKKLDNLKDEITREIDNLKGLNEKLKKEIGEAQKKTPDNKGGNNTVDKTGTGGGTGKNVDPGKDPKPQPTVELDDTKWHIRVTMNGKILNQKTVIIGDKHVKLTAINDGKEVPVDWGFKDEHFNNLTEKNNRTNVSSVELSLKKGIAVGTVGIKHKGKKIKSATITLRRTDN